MEIDDVATLTTEIVNLTLAARSFEEATSALRSQRDEARRAFAALQRQVWLATVAIVLILLLAILMALVAQAADDAAVDSMEPLVLIERIAAWSDALRAEPGVAPSVSLIFAGCHIV